MTKLTLLNAPVGGHGKITTPIDAVTVSGQTVTIEPRQNFTQENGQPFTDIPAIVSPLGQEFELFDLIDGTFVADNPNAIQYTVQKRSLKFTTANYPAETTDVDAELMKEHRAGALVHIYLPRLQKSAFKALTAVTTESEEVVSTTTPPQLGQPVEKINGEIVPFKGGVFYGIYKGDNKVARRNGGTANVSGFVDVDRKKAYANFTTDTDASIRSEDDGLDLGHVFIGYFEGNSVVRLVNEAEPVEKSLNFATTEDVLTGTSTETIVNPKGLSDFKEKLFKEVDEIHLINNNYNVEDPTTAPVISITGNAGGVPVGNYSYKYFCKSQSEKGVTAFSPVSNTVSISSAGEISIQIENIPVNTTNLVLVRINDDGEKFVKEFINPTNSVIFIDNQASYESTYPLGETTFDLATLNTPLVANVGFSAEAKYGIENAPNGQYKFYLGYKNGTQYEVKSLLGTHNKNSTYPTTWYQVLTSYHSIVAELPDKTINGVQSERVLIVVKDDTTVRIAPIVMGAYSTGYFEIFYKNRTGIAQTPLFSSGFMNQTSYDHLLNDGLLTVFNEKNELFPEKAEFSSKLILKNTKTTKDVEVSFNETGTGLITL